MSPSLFVGPGVIASVHLSSRLSRHLARAEFWFLRFWVRRPGCSILTRSMSFESRFSWTTKELVPVESCLEDQKTRENSLLRPGRACPGRAVFGPKQRSTEASSAVAKSGRIKPHSGCPNRPPRGQAAWWAEKTQLQDPQARPRSDLLACAEAPAVNTAGSDTGITTTQRGPLAAASIGLGV